METSKTSNTSPARSKLLFPPIRRSTKQLCTLQTSANSISSIVYDLSCVSSPRYSCTIKTVKNILSKDRSDTEYDIERIATLKIEQEKNNLSYQSKLLNVLKQIRGSDQTYVLSNENSVCRSGSGKNDVECSKAGFSKKRKQNIDRNKKTIRVIHQSELYKIKKCQPEQLKKMKKATRKAREIHNRILLDQKARQNLDSVNQK